MDTIWSYFYPPPPKKTTAEIISENRRMIGVQILSIERDIKNLKRAEGQKLFEVKQSAKTGNLDDAKLAARRLVQTRAQIKRLNITIDKMQGVSAQIQTMQSSNSIATAMHGCVRAIRRMNQHTNGPEMQRVILEFEKQTQMMELKDEMINDFLENEEENEEIEEESDLLVNKVFDEIGIDLLTGMSNAPSTRFSNSNSNSIASSSSNNNNNNNVRLK